MPRVPKSLLPSEQFTLHQLVDQAAHAVMTRTGAVQNSFDLRAIGKTNGRAGGIDGQLAGEVARHLPLIGQQQLLQLDDVVEFSSIRQLPAGIHRQSQMEGKLLSALTETLLRGAVAFSPVPIAPPAHDIEVLQGEPG